jgi:tetratricopeptide (TPR) repeat protein
MGHLADTYLKDGNASYAIHLLRDALPRLNTSGDIEMSSYFVGRLGEALIETGQEAEGGQLLSRALRLAEHMQYHFYEREWRLALARRARAQAAYQDAYEHLQRALQLFEALPPSASYVETLCQISTICLNLSRNEEALEHARRAAALSEQIEDSAAALTARGTLGVVLRSMGQNAEAIPLLEAAAASEGGAVQIDILQPGRRRPRTAR